jgi:hypothetical protein
MAHHPPHCPSRRAWCLHPDLAAGWPQEPPGFRCRPSPCWARKARSCCCRPDEPRVARPRHRARRHQRGAFELATKRNRKRRYRLHRARVRARAGRRFEAENCDVSRWVYLRAGDKRQRLLAGSKAMLRSRWLERIPIAIHRAPARRLTTRTRTPADVMRVHQVPSHDCVPRIFEFASTPRRRASFAHAYAAPQPHATVAVRSEHQLPRGKFTGLADDAGQME